MKLRLKTSLVALVFVLFPLYASGQALPVYFAKEIRGRVVDEDTGAPLEGAIIVARWDWLESHFTLHGNPYPNRGDALHMAEAVTDRNGSYLIPAWGPKGKGLDRPDDSNDPSLSIFKSGYVPVELRNSGWSDYMHHNATSVRISEWNNKAIKLKKFAGTPRGSTPKSSPNCRTRA